MQSDLTKSRKEAFSDISSRIEIGKELIQRPLYHKDDLELAQNDFYKWTEYNYELLKKIFADQTKIKNYHGISSFSVSIYDTFQDDTASFRETVQEKLTYLESLLERLELYSEPHSEDIQMNQPSRVNQQLSKEVFIVHGHDESAKEAVARLIEKVGLKALILHEKPNKGRTIIKKFEDYSNVGFAVVLLTPDDLGAELKDSKNLKPRARQNVILELGFFLGKLGFEKVCALHKGNIELPSDYDGVIFIPYDDQDGWQLKLLKELKAVGYDVNLNDIV